MKKLVSVLLALAMILAVSVTVFAEDTTLTIENSTGRTYAGYQLLTLTTSKKEGIHHTDHSGACTEDCYNYAYTVIQNTLQFSSRKFGITAATIFGAQAASL